MYSYILFLEDCCTYTCHPSYEKIGRSVGMSANTVRKYVMELENKGLIRTEPITLPSGDGRRRNANLLYTILPIQGAVESYYRRQGLRA